MMVELGGIYRLIEDMYMLNDIHGEKTDGGICKAGELFELIDLPDKNKKKYTLYPVNTKFPYHLYLRENDFERLFVKGVSEDER